MKKLILLLSLSFFLIGTTSAQEATNSVLNESFVEWNFGVAFLDGMDYPFPGTSVLWGESYTNENNLIFEFEVGFALPTLGLCILFLVVYVRWFVTTFVKTQKNLYLFIYYNTK